MRSRVSVVLLLGACATSRTVIARVTGEGAMRPLGQGCYVAGHEVYECMADAEREWCLREPEDEHPRDEIEVVYDDRWTSYQRIDIIGPCHDRWYQTFRLPPVPITVRDAPAPQPFVPLDALGLRGIARRLVLPEHALRDVCLGDSPEQHARIAVCVDPDGHVGIDRAILDDSCSLHSCPLSGVLHEVFAHTTLAGPPPAVRTCAAVEIVATIAPRGTRDVASYCSRPS
jgi:hypothetical protein